MSFRLIKLLSCTALVLHVGLLAAPASAQSTESLAQKLAELRAEVETLSSELTDQKTDGRNEIRALARQKSDLQIDLDREQVRLAKLRSSLNKKREDVESKSAGVQDLEPIMALALEHARQYVNTSLPFRRVDRLSELQKIEEEKKSGALSPQRALARIWGFLEDEFRMTKESALFRQSISIDGRDKLVDVVRVGMMMLFFQSQSGEVGYAKRTDKGWIFVESKSDTERQHILKLFGNFKKQIREGLFTLPNILSRGEA